MTDLDFDSDSADSLQFNNEGDVENLICETIDAGATGGVTCSSGCQVGGTVAGCIENV